MSRSYREFLHSKQVKQVNYGFEVETLPDFLFPFQRDIVKWALRKGRAAVFADCGLGKTYISLVWAISILERTSLDKKILIVAPLCVGKQTIQEGSKVGISVTYCKTQEDVVSGINITNYERLENFDSGQFIALVLDESSILKSYSSKYRNYIIENYSTIPYRLACTATPAPNDFMELGNHSEFLGVMSRVEMLATFFVHDGGDTSKWRLKGHAEESFWKWIASWAVMIKKPSDLGYPDDGFILPPLNIREHILDSNIKAEGKLFAFEANTLEEQRLARKASLLDRITACANLVNNSTESWIVWCELNDESKALVKAILDAVEVTGSDSIEIKEQRLYDFLAGKKRVLITKSSIAGFGLNLQKFHNMAFVCVDHSYESFYQAIRREWRFGQEKEVNVNIFLSESEIPVLTNLKRKEADAERLAIGMVASMVETMKEELQGLSCEQDYTNKISQVVTDGGNILINDDCVDALKSIDDDSIDYSIFSPPFASLYTYSASDRDMGNSRNRTEFYAHFEFLIEQLFRVLQPGRLLSFHCMNLPTSKERDNVIGLYDFRGELIRMFIQHGFIYHSEVVIWKDPVTAMQRTKALGLLYKQLKKDSCMSRQGIPDYLVTMRKPGENVGRVTKDPEDFPVSLWQNYASPVWMDINPSKTLQAKSAREDKDERHIAPLQLEVIERAIKLWTNPGDLVLTPFLGIGSEVYTAVKMGRKGIGVELKTSYFEQAVANVRLAEREITQDSLFNDLEEVG